MTDKDAQCPERCLGIEGHGGPHQTSDYIPRAAIEAEAVAAERARIREVVRTLTPDARALLDALAFTGYTMRQRDLAYALWGTEGTIRRVQAACQEARLAGWPLVSDGDGVRLETDPAEVAACALALYKRAKHQMRTARALRETAKRMREPMTLWEGMA